MSHVSVAPTSITYYQVSIIWSGRGQRTTTSYADLCILRSKRHWTHFTRPTPHWGMLCAYSI